MELFLSNENPNLLPKDGELYHFGVVFEDNYLEALLKEPGWAPEELVMFGKRIQMRREVIWFGTQDYQYSGIKKHCRPFSPLIQQLKQGVEELTGSSFNACLANHYPSGAEGMGWHSDDEPEIRANSPIASLSFGARRKFVLRHKQTREKVELFLESGSLIVMAGTCQVNWQHTMPKTKKVTSSRVNLTFRQMRES